MAPQALPRFTATTAPSDFRTHALARLWIPTQWRGTTPDEFGPLSSYLSLSTCAVPFDPGESIGRCFTDGAGFVQSDCLATLIGVTRLNWVRLSLRLAPWPHRGFVARDCSRQRPVGYMANGSFHDELLSVHKTQTVSLTHRISRINSGLPCCGDSIGITHSAV